MPKKHQISYIKPTEPKFIRQLKERVGFVEGPNVETKREKLPTADGNSSDSDDEKPVVVALKAGDLTPEEAAKFLPKKPKSKKDTESDDVNKKMTFHKPVKRINDNPLNTSSISKKMKNRLEDSDDKNQKKGIKNKSLLSFGDDQDDDDDDT